MSRYDVLIIGHPSKDIMVDHTGKIAYLLGGAITFSAHSAASCGAKVGAVTKYAPEDRAVADNLPLPPGDVYTRASKRTVSIRSTFFTADRERRRSDAVAIADPFTMEDIPPVDTAIYQLAGLMRGDIDPDMIIELSKRSRVAADAQGFIRCPEADGEMVSRDWPEKLKYLPYITYFKADAAEAEMLTGLSDTREAARVIRGWGAAEVLVSHNTEMIVCGEEGLFAWPVVSRHIAGRSGRGDTVFAAYITERRRRGMDGALRFATAAVSLKMEMPTPLKASREEIEAYMEEFLPV